MTERAAILARLARLAAANARERHLAERLADASRLILGTQGAAITVHNDSSSRVTLAATDRVAARLEDLQDVLGEGPCHEAFQTGQSMIASLTSAADSRRWPQFINAARELLGDAVSIRCFAMRPGERVLGTLSLYLTGRAEVSEPDETAQFLANSVGAALLRDPSNRSTGISDGGAWSSRALIHQATGMVIGQLQIGADDALALLRAHAYAHSTTLADIAEQVVHRRLDFLQGDS